MNICDLPTDKLIMEITNRGFIVKAKNPNKITLKYAGKFRDGGTTQYRGSDNKIYCIDGRINSLTKGEIFDRYPGYEGAQQLDKNNFSY